MIIEIKDGVKGSISLNTDYITSVEYHIDYDLYTQEPDRGVLAIGLVNGHTKSITYSYCGSNPFKAKEKYNELMKILKGESDDKKISF